MPISNLWKKRIINLQQHGNEFTYDEIAEHVGISRGNVSVVIRKMAEDYPDIVCRIEAEDGRVRYKFNYDVIGDVIEEDEPDIPEWMSPVTYENIIGQLGDLDGMTVEMSYLDWMPQFQRGGIKATVYEAGQKHPEYFKVFRVDNCIIV